MGHIQQLYECSYIVSAEREQKKCKWKGESQLQTSNTGFMVARSHCITTVQSQIIQKARL